MMCSIVLHWSRTLASSGATEASTMTTLSSAWFTT